MSSFIEQFHFIQGDWLWALLPLIVVMWLVRQKIAQGNNWKNIVSPQLFPLLIKNNEKTTGNTSWWLMLIAGLLTIFALANPSWQYQVQKVEQTNTSRVIVFDLSLSMLADDLKPSRLLRARFKVDDILQQTKEGQTGLVVFAGAAFVVTPLTRDIETILSQLKALSPNIMPAQGSRVDLGLYKARELMQQAGVSKGQIILITDGAEDDRAKGAAAELLKSGFQTSVLATATKIGAHISNKRGNILSDQNGNPIRVKLNEKRLKEIAIEGAGIYRQLSSGNKDIQEILGLESKGSKQQQTNFETKNWQKNGPYLVLLLIPIVALAFRKGYLLSVLCCVSLTFHSDPTMAIDFQWKDLWQRNDQQVANAINAGKYKEAAKQAILAEQRAVAEYRNADYKGAIKSYSEITGADAAYNRGNTLAKLKQYKEAITSYDEALKTNPKMDDAIANKKAIEKLLKEQQSADKKSSDKSDSKDSKNSDKNKQSDSKEASNKNSNDGKKKNKDNSFDQANKALDKKSQDKAEQEQEQGKLPQSEQRKSQQPSEESKEKQKKQPTAQQSREKAQAEKLSDEEKMAAEQWLRRIQDDPGGLLRRKFLYQYQQSDQKHKNAGGQKW